MAKVLFLSVLGDFDSETFGRKKPLWKSLAQFLQ